MIKFTLTIWVCSFLSMPSVCMAPMESKILYNSWYECARSAHQESIKMMSKLGYKVVNRDKIAMKYRCEETNSI